MRSNTSLNIEIVILGINPVSLALGEYLNRANYYHNYIIVGNKHIYNKTMDENYINYLPIIVGNPKISRDTVLIDVGNRVIYSGKPKLYVLTDTHYNEILKVDYEDIWNVDSRLINTNKKIMISPFIALTSRAEYGVEKKTGHLMGGLLIEYLEDKSRQEAEIISSDIPIYPPRLAKKGVGVLWYNNQKNCSEIRICKHLFPIKRGINLLLYNDLNISLERLSIQCRENNGKIE